MKIKKSRRALDWDETVVVMQIEFRKEMSVRWAWSTQAIGRLPNFRNIAIFKEKVSRCAFLCVIQKVNLYSILVGDSVYPRIAHLKISIKACCSTSQCKFYSNIFHYNVCRSKKNFPVHHHRHHSWCVSICVCHNDTWHCIACMYTYSVFPLPSECLLIRRHNWTQIYRDCFSNVCLAIAAHSRFDSFSPFDNRLQRLWCSALQFCWFDFCCSESTSVLWRQCKGDTWNWLRSEC